MLIALFPHPGYQDKPKMSSPTTQPSDKSSWKWWSTLLLIWYKISELWPYILNFELILIHYYKLHWINSN